MPDNSETTPRLITFTNSLWAAIDAARGCAGRAAWLEEMLWKCRKIRQAADLHGIERESRRTRLSGEENRDVCEVQEVRGASTIDRA